MELLPLSQAFPPAELISRIEVSLFPFLWRIETETSSSPATSYNAISCPEDRTAFTVLYTLSLRLSDTCVKDQGFAESSRSVLAVTRSGSCGICKALSLSGLILTLQVAV